MLGLLELLRQGLSPGTAVVLLIVIILLGLLRAAVRTALRRWRERCALEMAPAVYEAGGDAADVLRAVGEGTSRPQRQ